MKKSFLKGCSLYLAISMLFVSCSSNTLIESRPPGANLYMNGAYVGTTPYRHSDTKVVGTSTDLRFEKDGYETLQIWLTRNEEADPGAIIGGIFFLFPFLWTMKYQPSHIYDLQPLDTQNDTGQPKIKETTVSKAQKLRELKSLLDEKIITQSEFDSEKQKILEGNN